MRWRREKRERDRVREGEREREREIERHTDRHSTDSLRNRGRVMSCDYLNDSFAHHPTHSHPATHTSQIHPGLKHNISKEEKKFNAARNKMRTENWWRGLVRWIDRYKQNKNTV